MSKVQESHVHSENELFGRGQISKNEPGTFSGFGKEIDSEVRTNENGTEIISSNEGIKKKYCTRSRRT